MPNIGKGNDVRDHKTVTYTLRDKKCWSRDFVALRHYRMFLDIVARQLTSFCSSREFVSAIADAMTASFADSGYITNLSLPQPIKLPTSTLMSFIVTPAPVTF